MSSDESLHGEVTDENQHEIIWSKVKHNKYKQSTGIIAHAKKYK